MIKWILLSVFFFLVVGMLVRVFLGLWKDRTKLRRAWNALPSWERACLQIGTLFYACLPMLKSHPSSNSYIVEFLISLMQAMANGMFIVGVLAFLQKGHDLNKGEKSNA